MAENFVISSNNPNDGIGGGGCLCNPLKDRDCRGPYAVFTAVETDNNLSPYCVLSLDCAKRIVEVAETDEPLAAGENGELV